MKNRKFMLLLFVMLLIPLGVKAIEIQATDVQIDNKNVFKVYDNDATGGKCPRNTSTSEDCVGKSVTDYLKIIDGSNQYVGYCVEFGNSLGSGSVANSITFVQFLVESGKTTPEANAIVEQLRKYIYFGYDANNNSRNSMEYYLATQALVWEYLGSQGLYLNTPPKKAGTLISDEELVSMYGGNGGGASVQGVTVVFNVNPQNIRFLKSTESIGPSPLPSNAEFANTDSKKELIAQNARNYTNVKPTFSSADLAALSSMEINQSVTITDTKSVLTYYDFTCTDEKVSCVRDTTNRNKLVITAKGIAGDFSITFTRNASLSNGTESMVYQRKHTGSEDFGQAIAVISGNLPTVTKTINGKIHVPTPDDACFLCETIGYVWGNYLDNPKCELQENVTHDNCRNPEHGCYICNGEYTWSEDGTPEGYEPDDCELQEEIEEYANCVAEPEPKMCYVCPGNNYEWTDNPSNDSCVPHPEITDVDDCVFTPPTSGLRIAYISLICGMAAAIGFVYFYSKKPKSE